jgi:hypothetical protein
MSDTKMIRFIDSDYRDLFHIPDGGSIKITYPPEDGRGTVVRQCKHLDEMHTEIGGNCYHICEFSERMEAIGAKYEPELQLENSGISVADETDKNMFYRNDEKAAACIGQMRGDFGREGNRFWHSWFDRTESLKTPEFQAELQAVVFELRKDMLKDFTSMRRYCFDRPEARLAGEEHHYGFKMETPGREYYIRCSIIHDDYFYVFCYDKGAARELTKERDNPAKKPRQRPNIEHER